MFLGKSNIVMRKIVVCACVLFSSFILFSSCREGGFEPVRLLELYVVDTLDLPVDSAKVEFYFSEFALNANEGQIIETLYTDKEGVVKVALDEKIIDYYVNVEKQDINNWYTTTIINLPNLQAKNVATIMLNSTFEAKLTGRYEKRWQQTDDIINGNASSPNCANQLYHNFIRRPETEKDTRDGQLEKIQTSVCRFPGRVEENNQWIYDKQSNTLTFGIENFAETYKVVKFTENKMSLVYTTPDGAIVIEKKYKVVD